MICLGQTAIFLRGFDQASRISAADFQEGGKLAIQPDKGNVNNTCAVAVENRHGQFLGRVARERSKGCFELLRRIKSTNSKITATFSQLATEFGKYYKTSKSTAVHIQLHDSICRGDYGDVRQKQEELRNLVEQCNLFFTSSNLAERETSSNLAEREIVQDRSEFAAKKISKQTVVERKRPRFTFEGRELKLPNTPKRQKRRKGKA